MYRCVGVEIFGINKSKYRLFMRPDTAFLCDPIPPYYATVFTLRN